MHIHPLLEKPRRVFAIVCDEGDEVTESVSAFAHETGVDAASFTAIGGISAGTLGFFDPGLGDYRPIAVRHQAEVVSCVGDITSSPEEELTSSAERGSRPERTVHAHMVVAFADGQTLGGHLLKALVRPTFEVVVTESPGHLHRRHDPRTGLALIEPLAHGRGMPSS